jgi:hypothetical protein
LKKVKIFKLEKKANEIAKAEIKKLKQGLEKMNQTVIILNRENEFLKEMINFIKQT